MSAVDRVAIRRRSLVACLGCMGALPWAAMAQKRGTIYRIGIVGLSPTSEIEGAQPRSPQTAMFLRAMSQMGYTYGEHYVTLAYGVAGNPLGMEGLVHELVRQRPDVIVATGPALQALKRATSKIPIVMTAALDPVEKGSGAKSCAAWRQPHRPKSAGQRRHIETAAIAQGSGARTRGGSGGVESVEHGELGCRSGRG